MRGEREGGEQSPRGRMGSKGDGSGKEEEEREERGRQRKGGGEASGGQRIAARAPAVGARIDRSEEGFADCWKCGPSL